MKAKVKFDSAQLKKFLLHHVEKVVFGGFVVAFLLLCWSAFKLKPYPKTPDQLKAKADQVAQEVERATPPDQFADLPNVPDFTNLGAVGPAPVDPQPYRINPLSRPYDDRQDLRKEPKFFALEELLAFPGYGGIAINDQGGPERIATTGFGSGGGIAPEMGMPGMGMNPGAGMGMNPGAGMGMNPGAGMGMNPGAGMGMNPGAGMGMNPGAGMGMNPGAGMGMNPGAGMGMNPGSMMPGMGGGRARGRNNRGSRRNTAKKEVPKADRPRPKPQVSEKIALPQPPPGARVEGRYWVCLVGAIPYRKEFLEYQNTFRDSRRYDIQRDYPRYALPEIERAEVNGDKMGQWQPLDLQESVDDLRKWAVEYPEVVDKQFIDPDATEPLPPLIFANHDKDKINHPLTQLAEEKPKAAPVNENAKKKKAVNISGARRPSVGNYARVPVGMGMRGPNAAGSPGSRLPEYRLFRFFDFAVEPGKTYRYRVKLALVNPNADVERRYLENYAFGDGETREADWSQPSGPITVIAGNRMLAGGVSAGRGEPTGNVLAKQFDAKEAVEVRKIFDVHRGSVLNQKELEIGVPDPSATQAQPNRLVKVDVETDAVIVDMLGGEKLPGGRSRGSEAPPKVPGHFLVLDNDGALKTIVQSSDAAMYETETEEVKKQAPPKEGERKTGAPAGTPSNGFDDFNSIDTGKKGRGRR